MSRNPACLSLLLLFFIPSNPRAQTDAGRLVTDYIEAYNQHDIELMLSYLTDDFQWFSSSDGRVTVEASGKQQIARGLADYFENLPDANSVISNIKVEGQQVSVIEEAVWGRGDTRRSQCAPAVYEIARDKLASVTYFDVQPCPKPVDGR